MKPINLTKEELSDLIDCRFESLSLNIIEKLIKIGSVASLDPSEVIISQGDTSNEVYLLLSGRAAVYLEEGGKVKRINEINDGEIFGEMSLFTKSVRSTTVVCVRQSIVLKISGSDFTEFLDDHPLFYKSISTTLINRLARTNQRQTRSKSSRNIALYSILPDYNLDYFSKCLRNELKSYGSVQIVDSTVFARHDQNTTELVSYLNRLEKSQDFVLFLCPNEDNWVRKSMLDHSDRIFCINSLNRFDVKNTLPVIGKSLKFPAHSSIVFLILDSLQEEQISGSKKHLEDSEYCRVLHLHSHSDYARIARFIAGKSTKLVLSGGGAKGLSHLGVYKAILELGIEIDAVGGTSIGCIMSALIASRWDYDYIVQEAHKAFILDKPLKDYHLPLISLLKGKKLDESLESRFSDLYIEDLPIPFVTIAANLSDLKTETIDRGLVRDATRASISIPSIFPPAVWNGKLLIDGGIVDNMPFDAVQNISSGPIIGVDLGASKERESCYEEIPSNLQLAKAKISGKKDYKVPNIYQIIMDTMTLASDEKRRKNISKFDVYIQPDVGNFGFLDFSKFDELIERGYESSIRILENWLENQHG